MNHKKYPGLVAGVWVRR